ACLRQVAPPLADPLGLRGPPSEPPRAIVASSPPLTPDAAPNATPNGASEAWPVAAPDAAAAASPPETAGPPVGSIESMERAMIERALKDARFNKSKAARLLGLTRTQLYVRLRRYGLE